MTFVVLSSLIVGIKEALSVKFLRESSTPGAKTPPI
jgi:hypothetical protein